MKQNKRGILMLASMVLLISLMSGVQVIKAATPVDGELKAEGGIVLIDTDTGGNGKIDNVQISINYAVATADAIAHATDEETTAGKFTITNVGTAISVDITSIDFVSGDGTIAIFELTLDETNVTSATELYVSYDADGSNLKIVSGASESVDVASFSNVPVDGELKAEGGIVLIDTDTGGNGKIDNVQISINYAVATADAIAHATDEETTAGKFTITNVGTAISVDITSIDFVSGDGTIAIFELTLDETNVTSATELYVSYDADGSNLKIVSGASESVDVASFSNVPVVAEDEEDEDFIPVPDYPGVTDGPAKPNPNSGVTLYRVDGSPRVYVIKNKKKHWIHSPKEFKNNGYSWGKVKIVSAEFLGEYPDAETLATELLRAIGDYKVYKLENGKKSWIRTAGEFNAAGHKWGDIQEVSPETLASYQNAVLSKLLRAIGDYKVYKLENGKKSWIRTAGEFNAAGHKWKDVEEVPAQDLDDYLDSEDV